MQKIEEAQINIRRDLNFNVFPSLARTFGTMKISNVSASSINKEKTSTPILKNRSRPCFAKTRT